VEAAGASIETMQRGDSDGHRFDLHIWQEFVPGTGRNDWGSRLSKLVRAIVEQQSFDLVLLDWQIAARRVGKITEAVDKQRCLLFSTSLLNWNDVELTRPEVPMLIFCPKELEVPKFRSSCPALHYVEPSLRFMDEDNSPIDELRTSKGLVLAAFGSGVIRYPGFREQCKLIADLAVRQPELQFVLAAGTAKQAAPENFPIKPPNLLVVATLPQRKLLESSDVFITHGGLSSIKEAIVAGTPMIVLPALYDQPFNAMRVRYHNLGEAIFPEKLQIDILEAAVLRTLAGLFDPAVHSMREIFLARESAKPSFAIVDARLAGN